MTAYAMWYALVAEDRSVLPTGGRARSEVYSLRAVDREGSSPENRSRAARCPA